MDMKQFKKKWKFTLGHTAPRSLRGETQWKDCRYLKSCPNPPASSASADFHNCLQIKKMGCRVVFPTWSICTCGGLDSWSYTQC